MPQRFRLAERERERESEYGAPAAAIFLTVSLVSAVELRGGSGRSLLVDYS